MLGLIGLLIILVAIICYDMYKTVKSREWWYQEELRRHNEIVDAIKKGENDGEN